MKICEFKQFRRWCLQKKTPIGTRMPCYIKIVPRGFAGTITRHVFFCLQMKQHEFDFSTQENGKIILFIRSGLYICRKVIFVVSVLFRKASWTKNAVNRYTRMSVFCTLAKPLGLFNTYFSCLAFLFPTFTKFTTGFRKWHNTNI